MSNKIFFTPGPTQLFYTFQDHLRTALKNDIPSISHRDSEFTRMFQETREHLKDLFGLSEKHQIYFTGSANEIWERIIQNLIFKRSHHFVNGAFSKKFYDFALKYHKEPTITEAANGEAYESLSVPEESELIAITLNETSNGFMFTQSDLALLRKQHPKKLIAVDAVSALPSIALDFDMVDTAFLSVQKCFGMPAGLGVWISNDRCLEKAAKLEKDGLGIGSYHSLKTLQKFALKNQTPETPNVLSIYILGKIAEDMLRRGLTNVRNETVYKAAILYQTIEDHQSLTPFIEGKNHRSKTVIVAQTSSGSESYVSSCEARGWVLGTGYGEQRTKQLRIANFPMHSKEVVEQLCDFLATQE